MARLNKMNITRKEAMTSINALEDAIKDRDDCLYQDDMEYRHFFAPGLYVRELTVPDGMAFTTMIHASENIAFLMKGAITVYTEKGLERFEAPHMMVTKIGTKRAMTTHGEVIFTTAHHNPDNITDIDELVDIMTFKDETAYLEYEQKQIEVKL